MRLPTACNVRQAQLTSLWVSTVFHKWQHAKISRGNERGRLNKKVALLSVYSVCISVFVERCIGLLCVYLFCANTKPIEKGKQIISTAKIFFLLFSKTFGTIIFYYTVCSVTDNQLKKGEAGAIKNKIVMGSELGERKKPSTLQVFQTDAFQCPCQTGKRLLMHIFCGRGSMMRLTSKVATKWIMPSINGFAYYLSVFSVLSIRKDAVRMRKNLKRKLFGDSIWVNRVYGI